MQKSRASLEGGYSKSTWKVLITSLQGPLEDAN